MNEGKGFDPAGDESVPDAKPMENLLVPDNDDGWAPVEEDAWSPETNLQQLNSMMDDDPPPRTTITSSGTFDAPVHHNPLPPDDGLGSRDGNEAILGQEFAAPPPPPPRNTHPSGVRESHGGQGRSRRPSLVPEEEYNSNEAILASDVVPSPAPAPAPVEGRQRLPSRDDAPSSPIGVVVDSRPAAWLIPGLIFFLGVGAGSYVLLVENTILGGIAISLSLVGSLFLRVLLKH